MNTLAVNSPGFLTSVQDLGRFGQAHLGVSPAGAADPVALRLGNMLLGNPENTPALEMTLVGGSFTFSSGCQIAITGSDFSPALDGRPVPLWSVIQVASGNTLTLSSAKSGVRCYLCIRGGFDIPPHLGSASTHLLSRLGGLSGRSLQRGDTLAFRPMKSLLPTEARAVSEDVVNELLPRTRIRVTPGPEMDLFTDEAVGLFAISSYEISEESNRVGLRLRGPVLERTKSEDILTEGVSIGAVQVPPSGQPIVLFVEQPTTGGYPKIANVILADLPSVGQLKPRDEITFEIVDLTQARDALNAQEALISPSSFTAL